MMAWIYRQVAGDRDAGAVQDEEEYHHHIKKSDIDDMLYKVPADWELAKRFRIANRVMRLDRATIDHSRPETYCAMSKKPVRTHELKFDVCSDNYELHEMRSPGHVLIFQLLNHFMWLAITIALTGVLFYFVAR